MEKNIALEMSNKVLEILRDGGTLSTLEVVETLQTDHSELVALYMKIQESTLLGHVIRQVRHRDKERRKRSASSPMAEGSGMLDYIDNVSRDGIRLNISWGDFMKADHLTKAAEHRESGMESFWWEATHRAIAKLIPEGKTTREVLSNDELDELMGRKEN